MKVNMYIRIFLIPRVNNVRSLKAQQSLNECTTTVGGISVASLVLSPAYCMSSHHVNYLPTKTLSTHVYGQKGIVFFESEIVSVMGNTVSDCPLVFLCVDSLHVFVSLRCFFPMLFFCFCRNLLCRSLSWIALVKAQTCCLGSLLLFVSNFV